MWIYAQSTGNLSNDSSNSLRARGYSGAEPDGKNNPAMESVPDVGPIPRGEYQIGVPHNTESHGPFVMSLTPMPANEMFGRSGFLMHGDSSEHPGMASKGCIIMPRAVREIVWNSGDHRLRVISGEDKEPASAAMELPRAA